MVFDTKEALLKYLDGCNVRRIEWPKDVYVNINEPQKKYVSERCPDSFPDSYITYNTPASSLERYGYNVSKKWEIYPNND